jgi:hypothetical protein
MGKAVLKKITLSCVCVAASLFSTQTERVYGQFASSPANQQQPQETAHPAVPDDLRISLMIRNAIVALSQANTTGNYSVLRDMGTPNFQMTNSSARLAEVFATLRARKIDLSPIMFFSPKFLSPPALQDGQVLRLTGTFPTSPEQVNFDLAFQLAGEQWMLAGISVTVAPPGEGPQASVAAPAQASTDANPGAPAKPGEAKAVRIDLSKPAPAQPASPKKPVAAAKKPKPSTQKTAAAQPSAATPTAPAAAPPAAETVEAKPVPKPAETGSSWNPFGR